MTIASGVVMCEGRVDGGQQEAGSGTLIAGVSNRKVRGTGCEGAGPKHLAREVSR